MAVAMPWWWGSQIHFSLERNERGIAVRGGGGAELMGLVLCCATDLLRPPHWSGFKLILLVGRMVDFLLKNASFSIK
jgi:hypothetical protein